MLLKNIGKKKFIVRGEKVQEKPSKAHPKGREVTKTVSIAPGEHKAVPDSTAEDLLDHYPDNFVEYVEPKPRAEKKSEGEQKSGDEQKKAQ